MTDDEADALTTVFTQIDPPGRLPGVCWRADLYFPGDNPPFPVAIAWLSDYSDSPLKTVVLDFILVPDHLRRQGHATALIEACRERFGESLYLTDAISEAGEGLLRSWHGLACETPEDSASAPH